jgi:class 3 adenylate cyclase
LIVAPSFLSLAYAVPDLRTHFYEDLARHFKLVTYDGRGFGLSRSGTATYSLDERVEDLSAVAAATDSDRFRLLGQLYSSPTAIAFSARFPDRIERLLLIQAYTDGAEFYAKGEFGQVADALRDITVDQWEFASRATIMRGATPGTPPDILEQRAKAMREAWTPEAMLAFREANKRTNVTDELSKVQAPTLVVHSGNLTPLTLELARSIVSTIRNAHLLMTEVQWDAIPPETVGEILEFLGAGNAGHTRVRETSGVRTILFTDLVAHTEMMQRLGDERGRDVLREHERITRDLLKQHGGAEVKTMGDGFMASFASVTKAMDCAIALQRAFAAHQGEQLQVRVGLNAGEPIEEDGDLFGSTVIMASRIAAQAGAGEILIPEPLRHLLTGKSYVYADRGETMLKGFEDAVRLHEVRWQE